MAWTIKEHEAFMAAFIRYWPQVTERADVFLEALCDLPFNEVFLAAKEVFESQEVSRVPTPTAIREARRGRMEKEKPKGNFPVATDGRPIISAQQFAECEETWERLMNHAASPDDLAFRKRLREKCTTGGRIEDELMRRLER